MSEASETYGSDLKRSGCESWRFNFGPLSGYFRYGAQFRLNSDIARLRFLKQRLICGVFAYRGDRIRWRLSAF